MEVTFLGDIHSNKIIILTTDFVSVEIDIIKFPCTENSMEWVERGNRFLPSKPWHSHSPQFLSLTRKPTLTPQVTQPTQDMGSFHFKLASRAFVCVFFTLINYFLIHNHQQLRILHFSPPTQETLLNHKSKATRTSYPRQICLGV